MNNEREHTGTMERWICAILDWLIERAREGYEQKRPLRHTGSR